MTITKHGHCARGDRPYLASTLLSPRRRAPLQRPGPQGQARAFPATTIRSPAAPPTSHREPLSVSAWYPGCSMRLPPPLTPHSCPPHPERSPPPYTDLTRPQLKARHLTLPKLHENHDAAPVKIISPTHLTSHLTHSPTNSLIHFPHTHPSSHST